jgi:hypothetical protein
LAVKGAVRGDVVIAFDPSEEEAVEVTQIGERLLIESREESGADVTKPAFEFGAALGLVGTCMEELKAEVSGEGQERARAEDTAVVEVKASRETSLQESLLEAVLEGGEVLLVVELGVADEAGVIVEDGDEEGFSTLAVGLGDGGAVHDVALPAIAGEVEFEGAVIGTGRSAALVEAAGAEKAI